MSRPRSKLLVSVHFEGPLTVAALAAVAGKAGSPPIQAMIDARRRGRVPAWSVTLGAFTFKHPPEPGRFELQV